MSHPYIVTYVRVKHTSFSCLSFVKFRTALLFFLPLEHSRGKLPWHFCNLVWLIFWNYYYFLCVGALLSRLFCFCFSLELPPSIKWHLPTWRHINTQHSALRIRKCESKTSFITKQNTGGETLTLNSEFKDIYPRKALKNYSKKLTPKWSATKHEQWTKLRW